ncbi:L-rhamnonate dehydratase like protein [Verticillium longisporum]|nr:L-rhamnonate dehydratase like protein [Verticillium longisporum]
MLSICATYLLLDDIDDLDLFTESQKQAAAAPDGSLPNNPCLDDEDEDHEPAMSVYEDRFFDPVDQGFGPLFAYTASFWTSHLQSAPAEFLPSIDQLQKLSAFRSKRLSNWRDQYRHPDCTKREQHDMMCQDPLGIVTLFGPPSLLKTMVEESDFDDHYMFHQHSLVEALKLSLDHDDFAKSHILFQHPSVQYEKFFQEALACYHRKREGVQHRPLAPEWDTLFGIVHSITASLTRNKLGNALMCNAARYGCLPLLKHLLDAAKKNSVLMEVVLTPWREHPGADQGTAWAYHQSIARAARFSHVGTIKFLHSWPGIEAHFLHRDSFGFNVFHVAAQSQSSAETVALLLSHSNVGVDAETVQGDTPLNLYAFDHNCNLECVRLLLELVEGRNLDIIQPDVMWLGGLTELLKVSAMAAAYDIPVVPHASGPYSYHFVLSQPNTPFQEYLANSPDGKSVLPVFGDLFLDEPIPNKGFLTAADLDKPGFGLTLNPAARSKLISADRWLNPAPVAALTPAAPEVEAPKAVEAPKEESAPAAAVAAPVEEAKTNGVNGTTTNGVNGVVHDITAKVQELTTGSAEPVATN